MAQLPDAPEGTPPPDHPALPEADAGAGGGLGPRQHPAKVAPRRTTTDDRPILFEVAWEVCHQLGGIYQVLRSKAPVMVETWGDDYCLVGPFDPASAELEFEERRPPAGLKRVLADLAAHGVTGHYGRWIVSGHPRVVLLECDLSGEELAREKYFLWRDHGIALPAEDLIDRVVGFSAVARRFFASACAQYAPRPIIAHFHEWMGALAIPALRRADLPLAVVFTTHATRLGRQTASDRADFYEVLPTLDHAAEAARYGLGPIHGIERACAHGAHVFTTVSEVTGDECRHLLGRAPDVILPNGINIDRFLAPHHLQSRHLEHRHQIERFTRGHFFPYYSFDLDRTLYFYTSGRYEPHNKGFDLCLEAMARLNTELKGAGLGITVVFFIVTRRPDARINTQCLESRAVMTELEDTCQTITQQVGTRFFNHVTSGDPRRLDDLVDEYWRLRLRRTLHAWRRRGLPPVVTHDLPGADPVLTHIRSLWLDNAPEHPVKVVYHPEFITPSSPLWKMDYDHFIRGCHLGVFPSAYEPWGYTPLESLASGVPCVSSDLTGFGRYLHTHFHKHDEAGGYVIRRRGRRFDESAADLAACLLAFCRLDRRGRIAVRNRAAELASRFDWHELVVHYQRAHSLALTSIRRRETPAT
jgi:glycogen synthase